MKKLLFAAAAAFAVSSAAHASVIPVLDSVSNNGDGTFTFAYVGTLAGDQGLVKNQSQLVIYDFGGYVAGSIAATSANIAVSTELVTTTPGLFPLDGVDDPTLPNLVFKWIGDDFQTSGGPFPIIDFDGLSAKSTFGGVAIGDFAAKTVTNNGAATGRLATNQGSVGVPAPAIPEPSSWALLILGFGGAGAMLRQRRRSAFG